VNNIPENTDPKQRKSKLPLLEEFFSNLVNDNYSIETLTNYRRDLEVLNSFLMETNLEFEKLDKLALSRYKDYLRTGAYLKVVRKLHGNVGKPLGEGENKKSSSKGSRRQSMYSGRLGSRSVNRMLSAFRSYLRFLNDLDYKKVPLAPDSVKMLKTERKETQVAELKDLVKLIEAPEQFENNQLVRYRNRAILELLFSSGMRISEMINLNLEDLKISTDESIEESKLYILGKGKKQRFVYLTNRCKHFLERYLKTRADDYEALFIPYRGLRSGTKDPYQVRLSVNYVQSKIKEYRKRVGIIVPTSAHSLRHGFATYLAENGASPVAIQRLLGHESLQTTSKYMHSSDKVAEEVHKKYHPLQEE
jgi:site-specific recombinase XerD